MKRAASVCAGAGGGEFEGFPGSGSGSGGGGSRLRRRAVGSPPPLVHDDGGARTEHIPEDEDDDEEEMGDFGADAYARRTPGSSDSCSRTSKEDDNINIAAHVT
jgi:hypothetical protein